MSTTVTPIQFVAAKQAEFPRPEHDERHYSDYLRHFLAEHPELRERFKADLDKDYALHLLSRLLPRLPKELAELATSDSIAVGEVHDSRANAYCHVLNQGFAVVFNRGLKDFVYRIVRAFSTRFAPYGGSEPEEVSFDDTCRFIGDIYLWYHETESANGPDYPITEEQIRIANELTYEANQYFFAHEFAHGLLHLFEGPSESELSEEAEADRVALRLVLGRPGPDVEAPRLDVSYAGAEIALLIWRGLEEFGVPFEGTHPPASDRLEKLRTSLRELCPDNQIRESIEALAVPVRTVFENVLAQIKAPNYEEFLDRAARQVMNELDALLDRCTGGMVPDYMTFYSEAHRFFGHGYSLKLSERIAQNAIEWLAAMEGWRASGTQHDHRRAWITFQKHKLFLGFVSELRPEVRRVFERALGIVSET